jgi:hypothetical protein
MATHIWAALVVVKCDGEVGMAQSIKDQVSPIISEILKQIAAFALGAYGTSLFGLTDLIFPWTFVFLMAGVFISYAVIELVSIYLRELIGSSNNELGKDRATRRWLAVRYLVSLIFLLVVPIALYSFEYHGERLINYAWDFLRRDDTRFVRKALREILENNADYNVKQAAVHAIGTTNSQDAVVDLLAIAKVMQGAYEVSGTFRRDSFFCELAKSVGRYGNKAVVAIVSEYKTEKSPKSTPLARTPSLVGQFNSQFSPQFRRFRAEIVDTLSDRDITRVNLLRIDGHL